MFPPHVVALAALYLAALLSSFEQGTSEEQPGFHTSHEIAGTLGQGGEWENQCQAHVEDLDGASLAVGLQPCGH